MPPKADMHAYDEKKAAAAEAVLDGRYQWFWLHYAADTKENAITTHLLEEAIRGFSSEPRFDFWQGFDLSSKAFWGLVSLICDWYSNDASII